MAENVFPLFSQPASETISPSTVTSTLRVDSRVVDIDVAGDTDYEVTVEGPNGLVFSITVSDLDNDTSGTDATVTFKRGDETILVDADAETAAVMLIEGGFIDIGAHLAIATSGATFA